MEQQTHNREVTLGGSVTELLNKNRPFAILSMMAALTGAFFCFPVTYVLQTNIILGALILPFATFIALNDRRNNYWYLIGTLVFGIISLVYNIRIGFFFSLSFALLWLLEYCIGRTNSLAVFLVIFMSPVFNQAATILGFPIRLKLSALAGGILQTAGINVLVEGNTMILDNIAFSVDEACMGLNMLGMSMLIGTFLLAFQYRSHGKSLKPFQLVAYFVIVLILNLATNLCRIVLLVLFRIPPEAAMHEVVGLACFASYTVVPLYFISTSIVRNGSSLGRQNIRYAAMTMAQKFSAVIIVLFVIGTGIGVGINRSIMDERTLSSITSKTNDTLVADGVRKFSKENLLVYVKSIPEWFSSEHTPLYCWRGSGYVFSGIKEFEIAGRKIYSGRLTKNGQTLHTAWWYSNGEKQTISQLTWRGDMLSGEKGYYLINVTTNSAQTLQHEVEQILQMGDEKLMLADTGQ